MLYPAAPIFTSVFEPSRLPLEMRAWDVRPTALQRLPLVRHYSRALLPLMPRAFDRLNVRDYDVVITVSSAFSKNVRTEVGARNLCYCLTPPRYLWDLASQYLGGATRTLASPAIAWLRAADRRAADRVNDFLAISETVADRVHRAYGRTASIVFPPVDTDRVRPNDRPAEDFYLVVSRLVAYKRIDLAIDACNRLGRKLVVVGVGPERGRLERRAGPTIRFTGALSDAEIADLYARCRGFVFPGLEDFGITPVEAQAAGRPVISFGQGGAAETVVDGMTGIHFHVQSVDALADAIERSERIDFDPARCRENAMRFDSAVFRERMDAAVTRGVQATTVIQPLSAAESREDSSKSLQSQSS